MMNIRYRTSTNPWPGFVDLFSNLVIILIFLMIVFVFLWTTTSIFNKTNGAQTVAQLRATNAEQAQTIEQMSLDEIEAKRLLILARNQLEDLEQSNTELNNELNDLDLSVTELITAYEAKVLELQSQGNDLQKTIADLNTQPGKIRQGKNRRA